MPPRYYLTRNGTEVQVGRDEWLTAREAANPFQATSLPVNFWGLGVSGRVEYAAEGERNVVRT